jgi:hypothetical protein
MKSDQQDTFSKFLAFLERLAKSDLSYQVLSVRTEAVMVSVSVPGERWEIEFMIDDTIEVEVFKSSGHIGDAIDVERLFTDHV